MMRMALSISVRAIEIDRSARAETWQRIAAGAHEEGRGRVRLIELDELEELIGCGAAPPRLEASVLDAAMGDAAGVEPERVRRQDVAGQIVQCHHEPVPVTLHAQHDEG